MSNITSKESLTLKDSTKYFQLKRYNAWDLVENNPAKGEDTDKIKQPIVE